MPVAVWQREVRRLLANLWGGASRRNVARYKEEQDPEQQHKRRKDRESPSGCLAAICDGLSLGPAEPNQNDCK